MQGETVAKHISTQPRAKWFTSLQDLKKAFEKFKAKEEKFNLIPVIFHHEPMNKKKEKDVAILMIHPQTQIANMIALFRNMVSNKYKQLKKQMIYIYYRHKRYLVSATDRNTIQHQYNRSKDEDGFLHINYYFEGQYFMGPTGGELALIILAIPLIVAIEGTKAVYNWTTKAASNLKNPLSLFSSGQRYKFKETYSLQERKSKNKQFTEKNPNNVMIIVQKHEKSKLPDLPFIKFLAKQNMIYGQLTSLLQNRIRTFESTQKSMQKQSVFFSINNKIPDREATLIEIYQKYKHQDNIIYITYQQQETF